MIPRMDATGSPWDLMGGSGNPTHRIPMGTQGAHGGLMGSLGLATDPIGGESWDL